MADKVDSITRSRIMSRVRSKNTRLEVEFRRALWAAGVRGWRCHVRKVVGVPDLAWEGKRVAVFLDSAWWHGHPSRWTPGRLPRDWDEKIERNRARDQDVNKQLVDAGWTVVRLWDFEVAHDISGCVARVKAIVDGTSGQVSSSCSSNPRTASDM